MRQSTFAGVTRKQSTAKPVPYKKQRSSAILLFGFQCLIKAKLHFLPRNDSPNKQKLNHACKFDFCTLCRAVISLYNHNGYRKFLSIIFPRTANSECQPKFDSFLLCSDHNSPMLIEQLESHL